MSVRALLALLVFCCALPAGAAEGVLTLSEAVTRALADGADARIAHLEAGQAQHSYGKARGQYLPQIYVTSDAGWSNRINDKFIAAAPDGDSTVTLGLATLGTDRGWMNLYITQLLFDLKRWHEIEREQLAAEAAAISETRKRDDVAFEVVRRYAHLLTLQRRNAELEALLADALWLEEQAGRLLQAGRALEVDHSLAKLHHEELAIEARVAADEMRVARDRLWFAIGGSDSAPRSLVVESKALPDWSESPEGADREEVVSHAPELRVLDLRRQMEEREASAARAGYFPSVELVGGYSNYGPKRFDNFEDELFIGINFRFSLFDGLQTQHSVRGAEKGLEIARLRYQSTLDAKRAQVRELSGQIQTNAERHGLFERRLEAARERQRIADLQLKAGRGNLSEALGARERLARRLRDTLDASLRQVELWAALQRELGRLVQRLQ